MPQRGRAWCVLEPLSHPEPSSDSRAPAGAGMSRIAGTRVEPGQPLNGRLLPVDTERAERFPALSQTS